MSTTSGRPALAAETSEERLDAQASSSTGRGLRMAGFTLTPVIGAYAVLVLLMAASAIASSNFLTGNNLTNILRQGSPLAVVALGQTVVILAGGIDVSVGAVVTLATVVAARVMNSDPGMVLPTILLVLGLSVAVGLINGFFIGYLRADAFVTTLASMLIVNGAALVYTQGAPTSNLTPGFRQISEGSVAGIPVGVFIVIVALLLLWIALKRSVWGRRIYAVGANPRVAVLTGQPVARTVMGGYVLCSLCAGAGGLMLLAFTGAGDVNAGQGWELDAIASVLIGGTVFGGGRGGIAGTIAGAAVLTVLYNLFGLLALPDWVQLVARGVVVVVGVALYSRRLHTGRS